MYNLYNHPILEYEVPQIPNPNEQVHKVSEMKKKKNTHTHTKI